MQKEWFKGLTFRIVAPTRAQMCDIVAQFVHLMESSDGHIRLKWTTNMHDHYGEVKVNKVCKDKSVYITISMPDVVKNPILVNEEVNEDEILITSVADVIKWALN